MTIASAVVLFARAPVRDAKALGLGGDGDRRALAASLRSTLAAIAGAPELPLVVVGDAAVVDECRRAGLDPAHVVPQQGETFEDRLLSGLAAVASLGFTRIALIGSDTPDVASDDLRVAAREAGRVVVGPSSDGGFWLLGLDVADVCLLAGLPWRTPRVLDELRARLRAGETQVVALEARRDLDGARDLHAMFALVDVLTRRYLGEQLVVQHAAFPVDDDPPPFRAPRATPATGPPQ